MQTPETSKQTSLQEIARGLTDEENVRQTHQGEQIGRIKKLAQ